MSANTPLPGTDRPAAILVAVEDELRAILKRVSPAVRDSETGIRTYAGRLGGAGIVLAKSGMGPDRAQRAAELLIRRFDPNCLIVAGFCAGLQPGIAPGRLIAPRYVTGGESEFRPDRSLHAMICESNPSAACNGGLATITQILRTPAEKRATEVRWEGAQAADMETIGAAGMAERLGVPWVALRVVTDGPEDALPLDFARCAGPDGEVSRGRVALAALTHPWAIPGLVRLGSRSARAAGILAAALEDLVRLL